MIGEEMMSNKIDKEELLEKVEQIKAILSKGSNINIYEVENYILLREELINLLLQYITPGNAKIDNDNVKDKIIQQLLKLIENFLIKFEAKQRKELEMLKKEYERISEDKE